MLALLLSCLHTPVLSRLPVHVPAYAMPNDNEKRVPKYYLINATCKVAPSATTSLKEETEREVRVNRLAGGSRADGKGYVVVWQYGYIDIHQTHDTPI